MLFIQQRQKYLFRKFYLPCVKQGLDERAKSLPQKLQNILYNMESQPVTTLCNDNIDRAASTQGPFHAGSYHPFEIHLVEEVPTLSWMKILKGSRTSESFLGNPKGYNHLRHKTQFWFRNKEAHLRVLVNKVNTLTLSLWSEPLLWDWKLSGRVWLIPPAHSPPSLLTSSPTSSDSWGVWGVVLRREKCLAFGFKKSQTGEFGRVLENLPLLYQNQGPLFWFSWPLLQPLIFGSPLLRAFYTQGRYRKGPKTRSPGSPVTHWQHAPSSLNKDLLCGPPNAARGCSLQQQDLQSSLPVESPGVTGAVHGAPWGQEQHCKLSQWQRQCCLIRREGRMR